MTYVYADVVLIINMIMNSLILVSTAWALGRSIFWLRLGLSALTGAVYALGGVMPDLSALYHPIVKMLVSAVLVLIAWGYHNLRALLFDVMAFYLVSFVFGGAVLGWFFYLDGPFWDLSEFSLHFTIIYLISGALVALFLLFYLYRRLITRQERRKLIYMIRISYGTKEIALRALLDTGNRLYTIASRRPVVLVEQRELESLLSEKVISFFKRTSSGDWMVNLEKCDDDQWLSRVEVVPYKSVGHRNMLLAFRPDFVSVETEAGQQCIHNIAIGIYDGTLSGDGTYRALLHPAVLQNNDNKEEANICA